MTFALGRWYSLSCRQAGASAEGNALDLLLCNHPRRKRRPCRSLREPRGRDGVGRAQVRRRAVHHPPHASDPVRGSPTEEGRSLLTVWASGPFRVPCWPLVGRWSGRPLMGVQLGRASLRVIPMGSAARGRFAMAGTLAQAVLGADACARPCSLGSGPGIRRRTGGAGPRRPADAKVPRAAAPTRAHLALRTQRRSAR
jgi:hypothetical protein